MKNNLEYRGMLRLCLIFLFSFFPPPYLAHFPHGHGFEISTLLPNQQQHISGTVTDPYGPMPGVHVLIKGTQTGTFTDQDGDYSLQVDNTDTLVFTYLGYHTRELPVLGRTTLDIEMQSEVTELQEVEINAGYYTVKERERTGSISRVTAEEIELQPVANPLQAMQGRMTGVEIVQQSGVPGASMQIKIRGQNTLRIGEGDYPLYIVDGVPIASNPVGTYGQLFSSSVGIDPLNSLNPSNIKSIEVLKGPDATSIYGSRGANGVVLITTKNGESGKTSIALNMSTHIGQVANKLNLLNTPQYLEMRKEAFVNDGATPTETNAADLLLWDQNRYTDWQEELIGNTAHITEINTSMTGGSERTRFLVGGGYRNETTVFPGDFGYKKMMLNARADHNSVDNRLMVDMAINYGFDAHTLFNSNILEQALRLEPNAPALYLDNGELNWGEDSLGNPTFKNPMAPLLNTNNFESSKLIYNLGFRYKITEELFFKTNIGFTEFHQKEIVKQTKNSINPQNRPFSKHNSRHLQHDSRSLIFEPQLGHILKWPNADLTTLVGATVQYDSSEQLGIEGRGYIHESLIGNLLSAEEKAILLDTENEYRYSGLYARLGYRLKERYFLNLTGRRDGSSRFGPGNRFANFGAIGAAWIFSAEPFVQRNLSFLNFGKIRGSYGTTGNDQIPDYGYLATYSNIVDPSNFRGNGGLYPTRLGNPSYQWELNKKMEVAIDLGFFKDRLVSSITWYRNRSSNQLVGYRLPTITGFNTVQANLPAKIQNTGWEIQVFSKNVVHTEFSWTTGINLTIPKNKLMDFPNLEGSPYNNLYEIGEPLQIKKLYSFDGVDDVTGLYRIKDINGDGVFNQEDKVVISNSSRRYYGGFQNSISYKGLQLDFLLEFVGQRGNSVLNGPFGVPGFGPNGGYGGNQPSIIQNRWKGPQDPGSDIQRYSQSFTALVPYYNMRSSDAALTNTSFARLKNISLNYRFSNAILDRIHLEDCTFFVNAQNIFTWTGYNGFDPQFPSSLQNIPALRVIGGGVKLKF